MYYWMEKVCAEKNVEWIMKLVGGADCSLARKGRTVCRIFMKNWNGHGLNSLEMIHSKLNRFTVTNSFFLLFLE